MPNLEVKRKLAAILSADVEGYSLLMGEDEVGTIRTLSAYRRVISMIVQQHRGRVVDAPGDNLLAEFASVVDAVNCPATIILRVNHYLELISLRISYYLEQAIHALQLGHSAETKITWERSR